MADKKMTLKELEALYAKQKQISELRIEMLENERNSLSNVIDLRKRIAIEEEIINERQKIMNSMQDAYNNALAEGYKITSQTNNALQKRLKEQQGFINVYKTTIKNKQTILNLENKIAVAGKQVYNYLIKSDKVIKNTILNLGLSAAKAEEMRTSFEESAGYIARIGGNIGDIQIIMEGFTNETGRARALSSEMVKDIGLIGKGTGLGIEQATRLAAEFEYMGVNVKDAMDYVQGVVETSELMGVNTTKVLKNITDKFKKLQTFTFRQGVKGFAEMAEYSEKFSINMDSALNAAETSRNLENAINLAAQLQIMGGEFAKTDPFQLLFLSRNDPAAFTKKINEMTQGVVQFRKMADGSFEKFISPADRDRLAAVAKSLGISTDEIVEQSLRMADIVKMRQQMVGMGLTDNEKRLIEGMATFNSQTGKFVVQVAGHSKDIRDLTSDEIKVLKTQSKSLEDRALAAQTFDEAFKATIEEFKTILLPMLRGINKVLETIRPTVIKITDTVEKISDSKAGWLKVAGMLLVAVGGLKLSGGLLARAAQGLKGLSGIGNLSKGFTGGASQIYARGKARGIAASGIGGGMLKGGVGLGLAGAGTGAGIMLAAHGISELADSLSKLTPDQAKALSTIGTTLAITFPAAAIGMALAGKAAQGGALGIGVITLAVLGLGTAVRIATVGIGKMAESIAKARTAKADAFIKTTAAIKSSKDDFKEVEKMIRSISNADLSNLKPLYKLGKILNEPIKVEFADKDVALVSDITLNMDGYKISQRIAERVPIIHKELMRGKESGHL